MYVKQVGLIFYFFLVSAVIPLRAQTFNGTAGIISDDGTHNYYSATVTGVIPAMLDTVFGLETVCINLTHTWDDDLIISLISPDGTEFLLAYRLGGDGDNYTNTCFNNSATNYIYEVGAPFTGTFKPQGSMSYVNNGQNPNGTWQLHILDAYPFADTGEVLDWSITFGNAPAKPFPFTSTVLPLVVINTVGGVITDEPKVAAQMKIIRNTDGSPNHIDDVPNIYNGEIGIEQRGNSSAYMPKKSFNLETRNADSTNLNVALLDMPADNDWVLIANYSDKTLMRNYYSYDLFRDMDHWAPRMQFCELILDSEYQGIYLLGEHIKQGPDRVDVADLLPADTTGEELTGGYIFKVDWFNFDDIYWQSEFPAINATSNLNYILEYPRQEDVQSQQLAYIKSYVDSFELSMIDPDYNDTISGYSKYISTNSFIDYILLNEFTKNVDGYRLSTFLYKEKNGKLKAGPPWDYDLSWGNADYMEGWSTDGWCYEIQTTYTDQCPFWWQQFFTDTSFMNALQCRWQTLRESVFNPDTINHKIDSIATLLEPAIDLNFTKWPILGVYVWPNPSPIPEDYAGELNNLKTWVTNRITWLDENFTGTCYPEIIIPVENITIPDFMIYPNPNKGNFTVQINNSAEAEVFIYNIWGAIIYRTTIINTAEIHLPDISTGIYHVSVKIGDQQLTQNLLID